MNDLIDRQKAIGAIRKDVMGGVLNYEEAIEAIRKDMMGGLNYESILKRLISAQPEIIKCKDCKYWDLGWKSQEDPLQKFCPMIEWVTEIDFYCAYAERITDCGAKMDGGSDA